MLLFVYQKPQQNLIFRMYSNQLLTKRISNDRCLVRSLGSISGSVNPGMFLSIPCHHGPLASRAGQHLGCRKPLSMYSNAMIYN